MLKNPYKEINLPTEVYERVNTVRKLLFFIIVFSGVLYAVMSYDIVSTADVSIHFPIIYAFHELWLYVYPAGFILLLLNWQHLSYRSKYFRLIGTILTFIFFLTIFLMMISIIFIGEPSTALVYSIYLGHLALFLFYFTKYLRLWNRIFSGEAGQR